jgi:hypothetical protein
MTMLKKRTFAMVLATTLLLSGCAVADQIPDTASMRPFGNGTDVAAGELLVQDVTVVLHEDGTAVLTFTAVNSSDAPDELLAVAIGDTLATISADNLIAEKGTLRVGFNSDKFAQLTNSGLVSGQEITVSMAFAENGEISLNALVVPSLGEYAMVSPQPVAPLDTNTP